MQDREGVMMWLTENIQACLRDFLAAAASMARKRHPASTARGLFGFCLAPSIRKPIRPIHPIRGRTETSRGQEGLSLFIALRWMQEPGGVMVWLAENIQACLRIFRRTQHQWLARDILHPSQGVFDVFVL